jgi:serine/threonine protein phosphatase PrpC
MSSFQQESNIAEIVIKSLGKGQDDGRMGEYITESGEKCEWMVGMDGHGSNIVINFLRTLDWESVMKMDAPFYEIVSQLSTAEKNVRLSGATYVHAKMFSDRVETFVVGDSEVFVYVNGLLAYHNVPHNLQNPLEAVRLKDRIDNRFIGVRFDENIPHISGDTVLIAKPKEVIHWENNDALNLTQSLGHQSITGISPEISTIAFEPGDRVTVIICSDGATEMLLDEEKNGLIECLSAKEISDLAERRWRQEWTWKGWDKRNPDRSIKTSFGDDGIDDILVMKWCNNLE